MFAARRQFSSLITKRGFSSTVKAAGPHYPEGPYNNLPFKVHGRKFIPYWLVHWSFFGIGFGIPFFACWYQLKKSGNI